MNKINSALAQEDFFEAMKFGYESIPAFENLFSANFKISKEAVKKYVEGNANPHPSVMEKMVDWIESRKNNLA